MKDKIHGKELGKKMLKSVRQIPNDDLLKAFDKLHAKKIALAKDFETKQSFEMAYIALWSMIECNIKCFEHAVNQGLTNFDIWISCLEELAQAQMNSDSDDSDLHEPLRKNLPRQEFFLKFFGADAPALIELMDTKKKYRRKRNKIAHSAEPFGRRETYENYKAKTDQAINEFRDILVDLKLQ